MQTELLWVDKLIILRYNKSQDEKLKGIVYGDYYPSAVSGCSGGKRDGIVKVGAES